jgi:hypothetical protein
MHPSNYTDTLFLVFNDSIHLILSHSITHSLQVSFIKLTQTSPLSGGRGRVVHPALFKYRGQNIRSMRTMAFDVHNSFIGSGPGSSL